MYSQTRSFSCVPDCYPTTVWVTIVSPCPSPQLKSIFVFTYLILMTLCGDFCNHKIWCFVPIYRERKESKGVTCQYSILPPTPHDQHCTSFTQLKFHTHIYCRHNYRLICKKTRVSVRSQESPKLSLHRQAAKPCFMGVKNSCSPTVANKRWNQHRTPAVADTSFLTKMPKI